MTLVKEMTSFKIFLLHTFNINDIDYMQSLVTFRLKVFITDFTFLSPNFTAFPSVASHSPCLTISFHNSELLVLGNWACERLNFFYI